MTCRLVCFVALAGACLGGLSWLASQSLAASRSNPAVDKELVQELTSRLGDSRSVIRREAIVRLAQIGPGAKDALPGLGTCLEDSDPFVRAHAARAVYRVGQSPDLVVPVLVELLQPDYPQVCCLVSLILGEIGPAAHQAIPTLHTCLKTSDMSIRMHAAEACLHIDAHDVTATRELLAAMDDDQTDNRYFATNALGAAALDNPQAKFALLWALTDDNANVAIAASFNLSKRFDLAPAAAAQDSALSPEEIDQLIDKLRDPSAIVRQTAAIKLGMAGPAARIALTALRESLSDADRAVRLHVAHALWQIDRQAGEVVPELIDMLGVAKPHVSVAAVSILGEIGPAAEEALPSLADMFVGSTLRERMHLACMFSRIDSRDREMIGIVAAGLLETAGDVRYLAAIALGCSPVGHQKRVERALVTAREDRNLRVQSAAAEAQDRLHVRITLTRNALSAQYATSFTRSETPAPTQDPPAIESGDTPPEIPADASRGMAPGWTEAQPRRYDPPAMRGSDRGPTIADVARSIGPEGAAAADEDVDPDEGLKSIGVVRASIKMVGNAAFPPDYAAVKVAAAGPAAFQGLGYRRGWTPIGFGWDAPAVCFQPLYFEDINVERYGIHFGFFETVISTGRFSKNTILLPYHLLIQPMGERIYTLGYERPSNCVPLHCFHTARLDLSLRNWIDRCRYRPYRAACPWDASDDVCDTDCGGDD